MREDEMTRSISNPKQYNYLTPELSKLYDEARRARDHENDVWATRAVELILALAQTQRRLHQASRY